MLDFSDYFAGIADGKRIGGNIFYDYTSGSDHAIITNGYSGQYADVSTYPYVVADGDWFCIFQPAVTMLNIKWMSGCIETTSGRDKNIVAKRDFRLIKNYAIDVHVEVFSQFDIVSVVAMEGRFYNV